MHADIREVLVSEESIARKVTELATEIDKDYRNKNLLLICILKGSFVFTGDLSRALTVPHELDFISAGSYGNSTETSGEITLRRELSTDISGYDVLVVEDIIDTGLTLSRILEILEGMEPKSLKLCTLLNKPQRRTIDIKIDYEGILIPDMFVVGYGLDFGEKYRNLPYIGVLKPELYGEEDG